MLTSRFYIMKAISLQTYRFTSKALIYAVLISTFWVNSVPYLYLLSDSDVDIVSMYDPFDKETVKEEKEKEEKINGKVQIHPYKIIDLALIVKRKSQHAIRFQSLHDPDIQTPPPEWHLS